MTSATKPAAEGRNGVVIHKRALRSEGAPQYRNYEVHQRERVGESTEKIKPIQLVSEDYRLNPYPLVAVLRDNYPCYRDWLANSYWISQYNDVTSIFADDANFETRSKTWSCGLNTSGRDLGQALPVLTTRATQIDRHATAIAATLASSLAEKGEGDLATDFSIRFSLELLLSILGIPESDAARFAGLYWRLQRGTCWDPQLHRDGLKAFDELVEYFRPMIERKSVV